MSLPRVVKWKKSSELLSDETRRATNDAHEAGLACVFQCLDLSFRFVDGPRSAATVAPFIQHHVTASIPIRYTVPKRCPRPPSYRLGRDIHLVHEALWHDRSRSY